MRFTKDNWPEAWDEWKTFCRLQRMRTLCHTIPFPMRYHNPTTACSAVTNFFFFLTTVLLTLPFELLVRTLLTLPVNPPIFFFFLTPPVLFALLLLLVLPVDMTLDLLLPSFFSRSCFSFIRRSSSSQKSALNISHPSMNSPSIPPLWFMTIFAPPSLSWDLGRNSQRRRGKFRRRWEGGLGTSFKLNWRSDLFVCPRYLRG